MAERHGESMRLDVFLWYVRVAKTRAAAQALAATGRMRLDGRLVERAATPVREGNILTFAHGTHVRALRVEALPCRRGPAPEAQACYLELTIGGTGGGTGGGAASPGENLARQARLD